MRNKIITPNLLSSLLVTLIVGLGFTAEVRAKPLSHLGHMADDNVFHHPDCVEKLKGGNLEADYAKIISFMRANRLDHLLEPIDRGEVIVVLDKESANQFDVKWAYGPLLSNKRVITIKNLTAKTERQWQSRMWQVAIALYETAAAQRLFSKKSMIAQSTLNEVQAAHLPWYKALPKIADRLIGDWSTSRVNLYSDLQTDLYKLLQLLPLIDPRRALPEYDSRTHWVTDLVTLGSDWGDPRPMPNVQDYLGFNTNPDFNINDRVRRLHRDSFSFNYFVKCLTRFIVFSFAYDAGVEAYHLAPIVIEIPGVMTSSAPRINTSATDDDIVEKAYLDYEKEVANSPTRAASER